MLTGGAWCFQSVFLQIFCSKKRSKPKNKSVLKPNISCPQSIVCESELPLSPSLPAATKYAHPSVLNSPNDGNDGWSSCRSEQYRTGTPPLCTCDEPLHTPWVSRVCFSPFHVAALEMAIACVDVFVSARQALIHGTLVHRFNPPT